MRMNNNTVLPNSVNIISGKIENSLDDLRSLFPEYQYEVSGRDIRVFSLIHHEYGELGNIRLVPADTDFTRIMIDHPQRPSREDILEMINAGTYFNPEKMNIGLPIISSAFLEHIENKQSGFDKNKPIDLFKAAYENGNILGKEIHSFPEKQERNHQAEAFLDDLAENVLSIRKDRFEFALESAFESIIENSNCNTNVQSELVKPKNPRRLIEELLKEKRWEQIEDVKWDRIAVECVWYGWKDNEISDMLNREFGQYLTSKTITNRLAVLRNRYGNKIVPYRSDLQKYNKKF